MPFHKKCYFFDLYQLCVRTLFVFHKKKVTLHSEISIYYIKPLRLNATQLIFINK